MAKYKVVDDFNGGEDNLRFDSLEAAREQLEKEIDEFFSRPGRQNARCCLTIVPADAEWYFNPRHNRFEWDKTVPPEEWY